MSRLLDEDDVERDDQGQRAGREQRRPPPPDAVLGVLLLAPLVRAREPPNEALELVLRLRLRREADADRDDGVADEGRDGAPEARVQRRPEGERRVAVREVQP